MSSKRWRVVGSRVALFLAAAAVATLATAAEQQIAPAGSQALINAPTEYFTNRARIDPVWPANDNINASGALVTARRCAQHGDDASGREWNHPMART